MTTTRTDITWTVTTVADVKAALVEAGNRYGSYMVNGADEMRAYLGTTADGEVYAIDGNGYGRMRWTVVRPDGDYCNTDTMAEARAEA